METRAPDRFALEDEQHHERMRWVVSALKRADGPMGMPELAATVGVTTRELQHLVHELRLQGEPIGSSSEGFFLIRNVEEYERTVHQLRSRVFSLFQVLRGLRRARRRFNHNQELEQIELF